MKTKRAYLVGCPRSGTTLLQSMIASHSRVVSFPETHFYSKTLPINPILRRIRMYGHKSRTTVKHFLQKHDYAELASMLDTSSSSLYSHKDWCQKLSEILEKMTVREARRKGAQSPVWGLEKTPRHLHYISSIRQSNPDKKFIHIIRDGREVVASLHLATKKHPEEWDGVRSIDKCIKWWNESIRVTLKYQNDPDHFIATYDQLLESPERVLEGISNFLDLAFRKSMVGDFHNTARDLKTEKEKWKQKNCRQCLDKSNKLQHFDDETIRHITENTLSIDLKQFYH